MTKEDIKTYSMRISQGTNSELVVITYDIINNYLETAIVELDKGNVPEFTFNLNKAKQFINNLAGCLDFEYELSFDLLSLYLYATRTIVKAIARKETSEILRLRDMIGRLRKSFDVVSKADQAGSAMQNSEKVYAGLTYGKDKKVTEYSVR